MNPSGLSHACHMTRNWSFPFFRFYYCWKEIFLSLKYNVKQNRNRLWYFVCLFYFTHEKTLFTTKIQVFTTDFVPVKHA